MKELADRFAAWREHPSRMVRELWGETPDPWQHDALEAFPHSPRMAMQACQGPGKTTVLAWIGWNFLLTRPFPAIGASSVDAANLQVNDLIYHQGRKRLTRQQYQHGRFQQWHLLIDERGLIYLNRLTVKNGSVV